MAMMMMVGHGLDVLADEIPALLAGNGYTNDSCVVAARVACLALAEMGVKASPLPVAFNGHSDRSSALDAPRRFSAHLVTLVERRTVLDAHEGVVFPATPTFMAGEPIRFPMQGSTMLYRRIEDNTYQVADDWTSVQRDSPLVRAAVRAMRSHSASRR